MKLVASIGRVEVGSVRGALPNVYAPISLVIGRWSL